MADALDVLTLNEAKAVVNLTTSDTSQDTELALYVTAVSRQLDRLVGPVVTRSVTEYYDGGNWRIFLRSRPVAGIADVTEVRSLTPTVLTVETTATQTGDAYLADYTSGLIIRRESGSDACFASGRQNIVVQYTCGRTTTSSVDPLYKEAASIMLANLWRHEQGGGTETFGAVSVASIPSFALPHAVVDLLADEIQAPEIR